MKLYQLQAITVAFVLAFMGGLNWLSENVRPLPTGSTIKTQCQAIKSPTDYERSVCADFGFHIK